MEMASVLLRAACEEEQSFCQLDAAFTAANNGSDRSRSRLPSSLKETLKETMKETLKEMLSLHLPSGLRTAEYSTAASIKPSRTSRVIVY